MNKMYLVRFTKFVEGGVENWGETFSTLEDAQARINAVNVEGSDTTADPNIEDISENNVEGNSI